MAKLRNYVGNWHSPVNSLPLGSKPATLIGALESTLELNRTQPQ
jgi:hypothetical protein